MTDAGIGVFCKFIEKKEGIDDETRRLVTVALLLSSDDRLIELLNQREKDFQLDGGFVTEILVGGTPDELASVLWSTVGLHLPEATFKALYERVRDEADTLEVLHRVVGAAIDYLRLHSGAFGISQEVAQRLLRSDDVEARIIGLKCLRHCDVGSDVLVSETLGAMRSENWYECQGALHEVGELIGNADQNDLGSIDCKQLDALEECIKTLAHDSEDPDIRRVADVLWDDLQRIREVGRSAGPANPE